MPLFWRKKSGGDLGSGSGGDIGSPGAPAESDVADAYEMSSSLSFADDKVRVEPRNDQTVSVLVSRRGESAAVEVYAPDLRRAVYVASLPISSVSATVRAVGGTVGVEGHPSSCRFRVRDYNQDEDVWADAPAEALAGLVAFLDEQGGLAPALSSGEGLVGDAYEAELSYWRPQCLSVKPDGDQAVITATETVTEEREQVETVKVPLETFAGVARLAGGDLPGGCHFSLRRGSLSALFDRRKALSMHISTDEVDGDTIIAELNGEQLQDLRRYLESWLQPPDSPDPVPPVD